MIDLSNVKFYTSKKSTRGRENKDSSIFISFTKNKAGYVALRFYIGKLLVEEYSINENTKISFGHDTSNFKIWYLKLGNDGYSIRKDRTGSSYSCIMGSVFEFIEKKMQVIGKDKLNYYPTDNIICLNVENIFIENELKLLNN